MTTQTAEYISPKDTAKLIRGALREHFPGVKFSVRTDTYSGGSSIRIRWTDGPCRTAVERITDRYQGADFDGMIDMKTYNEHWLLPDGTVELAHARGTVGSGGCLPEEKPPRPIQGKRVYFAANFVFCNRDITDRDTKAAIAQNVIRTEGKCDGDRFGNDWISTLAHMAAERQHPGESIEDSTRRVAFGNSRMRCCDA